MLHELSLLNTVVNPLILICRGGESLGDTMRNVKRRVSSKKTRNNNNNNTFNAPQKRGGLRSPILAAA